mmetsp:Transcript_30/g.131  ORF Transcript_30/g.131 Transcript_30/m.131 type:complete len:268 (+) Transcript_30:394-1197(+)
MSRRVRPCCSSARTSRPASVSLGRCATSRCSTQSLSATWHALASVRRRQRFTQSVRISGQCAASALTAASVRSVQPLALNSSSWPQPRAIASMEASVRRTQRLRSMARRSAPRGRPRVGSATSTAAPASVRPETPTHWSLRSEGHRVEMPPRPRSVRRVHSPRRRSVSDVSMCVCATLRPSRTASKWKMASVMSARSSRLSVSSFHRLCVTTRAAASVIFETPARLRYCSLTHRSPTAATPSSVRPGQKERSRERRCVDAAWPTQKS